MKAGILMTGAILLASSSALCSDEAVEAFSPERGLRLSKIARSTIGISTTPLASPSPYTIPASSLVYSIDTIGVYRERAGWFRFVEVNVTRGGPERALIRSRELEPGDRIVVTGVALLRVADMEARGESGE